MNIFRGFPIRFHPAHRGNFKWYCNFTLPETGTMDTISQPPDEQPRRRRRSRRKSSKEIHERRRRMKNLGFWLAYGTVGVIIATAIAILAGQSSAN